MSRGRDTLCECGHLHAVEVKQKPYSEKAQLWIENECPVHGCKCSGYMDIECFIKYKLRLKVVDGDDARPEATPPTG